MEQLSIILFTSSAALLLAFLFLLITRRRINLPPSPPSLPIIGHLHLLKHPVYRLYHRLSQKYGPIFSLRFGSRRVVVVASSALVEECFTKNDIVLANRPRTIGGKHLAYDHSTMAAASYGDHWRNLRRIGAVEIFSSARLNAFLNIRTDEIRRLLLSLSRESRDKFTLVQLRPLLNDLTFNNIMRMVAGKRYYGKDITGQEEEEAKMFRDLITQAFLLGGAANPREFLPILNWIGTGKQSYEQKVKNMAESFDGLLQGLVDERRRGGKSNTMIDHLLSLQESQPEYYTDLVIKGLIFVLLLAGTDTSAVTLEWAMSNLLNHPNVLKKVRDELETQIGQEKLLEEQDIAKLPYLQNVIWETMRLYPAAPMLLPHVASADCKIGGYDVPRDTMVVVNAWAIHRDPEAWEEAESFKPERFEKDEQRESHKMIPFGLGRRACPGAGLAQRVIALALGSIIQCFDWAKTEEDDGQIDMSEGTGTTMPKAQPLEALCRARPIVYRLLYDAA